MFLAVVSSDIVFVTLLPTAVETLTVDAVTTVLTFYHFDGQVLVGHRYQPTPFPPVPNQP